MQKYILTIHKDKYDEEQIVAFLTKTDIRTIDEKLNNTYSGDYEIISLDGQKFKVIDVDEYHIYNEEVLEKEKEKEKEKKIESQTLPKKELEFIDLDKENELEIIELNEKSQNQNNINKPTIIEIEKKDIEKNISHNEFDETPNNFEFIKSLNKYQMASFITVQISQFLNSQNLAMEEEGINELLNTYLDWFDLPCNEKTI